MYAVYIHVYVHVYLTTWQSHVQVIGFLYGILQIPEVEEGFTTIVPRQIATVKSEREDWRVWGDAEQCHCNSLTISGLY